MKLLIFILTLLSFDAVAQTKEYVEMLDTYYDDFPTISQVKARKKVGDNDVVFLDTRELKEYNVSHIKNAVHVGYDSFELNSISHIPKDKEIIVYCSVGARSQNIGKKLKKAGYTNVKNLYGGLFLWANNGFPMVNSKQNGTTRIHGYSKEWGKWVTKGTVVY